MSDGSPSSLHSPTGETAIGLAERLAVRWRRAAAPRFRARTQERAHPHERAHRNSAFGGKPETMRSRRTLSLLTHWFGRALQANFACWRSRSAAAPSREREVTSAGVP